MFFRMRARHWYHWLVSCFASLDFTFLLWSVAPCGYVSSNHSLAKARTVDLSSTSIGMPPACASSVSVRHRAGHAASADVNFLPHILYI